MTRLGKPLKSILVLAAAAILVCTAVYAWLKLAPRRVPVGQPPLATIRADSVPAFRDTFNAAEGEVRLLVMLSPT